MKPFYREKYGGCMVLSVDDDPINQMVVENLLSPEGYKVEQAMSGSEALDFLKKTATLPDVILLDIMMPDMSGYEVCQEIRRRYSAVSIPIIMVSAKGHPEHVMKGLEAGSVDYVKKPFHRQELLSRIRAQVRNREIFEAEMESRKVTEMLKRILPLSVIQRLQQGQSMIADAHDEVTVLFADVAGWLSSQSLSSRNTTDVVLILNEMYSVFEKLLLKYQVFRVEHTGESYLVVSGHDGTGDHIKRVLSMAVDMLSAVQQLTFPGGQALTIRIGVHTGPAYAGVVGIDNPRYCVFGDTVSVANALEAKGFDNTIHCSNAVYAAVRSKEGDRGSAKFAPARKSMATGSDVMDTFIFKGGSWEAALKQLEEEEREKEALERESKQTECKEGDKEADKEGAEQAKARAEALEAQVQALEVERKAAEARAEAEATEKRLTAEKLAVEKAEKAAARAQADLLRNRAEAAEAERQKLKDSMAVYERLLAEARNAVATAAAHAATNGNRGGGGNAAAVALTGAAPLVSFHEPHAAAATTTAERDLLFSPEESLAPSDIFPASVAGSAARGPGSVVAGQVSQSFWNMTYPIDMFLRDIGLPQYVERMRSQEITPLVLASMKEKELEALGVETLGARRRIIEASKQYATKVKSTAKMVALYRDGQTLGGGVPGLAAVPTPTPQPPLPTGVLLAPGAAGLRPLLTREPSVAEAPTAASGTGGAYGLAGSVRQVIDLLE
ncbi:hypothetical protein Vretifemale_19399 [Volvox reticuliferus]|uniref:Guanylate cyclase n=2 Tax=Volvox reticuliferus TaxID=1737510 RepID=A0A8J4D3C2_9CHLO|nr:hypothetical protein Vretifemale_19399 [Volvox reticuliferus]